MPNQTRVRTAIRLSLEGLVVLVSILIAFFLDGWGADREEERELRQELVNVARELDRNHEIVVGELDAIYRIVSGTEHLLSQLEASPSARVSVQDSIVWQSTIWTPTLHPSLGAVDALITSGRLAQIEDASLRLGLAGLRDMLIDASEEGVIALRATETQLQPMVFGSPGWDSLHRLTREFLGARPEAGRSLQEQTAGGGFPTFGHVEYPNHDQVRSVLYLRLMWYEAAIAELLPLLTHLENLSDQALAAASA